MKRLFTLLIVAITATAGLNAQVYSYGPQDSTYTDGTAVSQYDYFNYGGKLKNLTADSTLRVNWEVTYTLSPTDTCAEPWDFSFCDKNNCYGVSLGYTNFYMLNPGDSADMKAQITPGCCNGYGEMWIEMWIGNDRAGTAVTAKYTADLMQTDPACFVSVVEEVKPNTITVYPNPVRTMVNIDLEGGTIINRIEMYNILGSKVYNKQLNSASSKTAVDVSDYHPGMYIIKAYDANSNVVHTKTFQKVK